jgi:Flp pilus assembly protein TadB
MKFSLSKAPLLALYALAAAFLLYWHWRHVLDAMPFLVVLACPLMHLFMHHGHGHHRDKAPDNSEKHDV